MTLFHVCSLEVWIVWFSSPVMVQMSPHIFKSIQLSILDPSMISHSVKPEWWPVVTSVSSELVIELKLSESITSSFKVAGSFCWLIDASIMMGGWTSDICFDGIAGLLDIWSLHIFLSFNSSSASTRASIWEATVECFAWVHGVPCLTAEFLEKISLVKVAESHRHWSLLTQELLKHTWSYLNDCEILHF